MWHRMRLQKRRYQNSSTKWWCFFSLQITIEPPQGLRANLLVAYDSKPIRDNKYYQLANGHERFQKEFERLVYGKMIDQNMIFRFLQKWIFLGICFFHGVVLERRRYGPVGWNNARYGFNVSDLNISLMQMKEVLIQVGWAWFLNERLL